MPKRASGLWEVIVSDDNLERAIVEVNKSHRWGPGHVVNHCTRWVQKTAPRRVEDLREILGAGFEPAPPRVSVRYDGGAGKWRIISEPLQWPDQYVHHALIQVIEPVCMRGMDPWCCSSIRGRGISYGKRAIERWMRTDPKGTARVLACDIRHFYDSIRPINVVMRFKRLIKDRRTLDLIWRIVREGVPAGYYTSQWFANTFLQPLDVLIREDEACKHYVRYMDNITVFGSNKRKLHRLRVKIGEWLESYGMRLKGDWQVFATRDRLPDAMGYRYGHDFTIPRKRNVLKLRRAVARYRKLRDSGRFVPPHLAAGILSRYGQIKHCNHYRLYQELNRGERIQHELKTIIRRANRRRTRQ